MRSPPTLALPEAKYKTEEKQRKFFDDLLNRIDRLPGVEEPALMTTPLLSNYLRMTEFSVEGSRIRIPASSLISK